MPMKLSEKELQDLAAQLRCPEGDEGREVSEMMNVVNGNMIQKAIESLQLKDNSIVLEIGPGNGSHAAHLINSASNILYHGIDISETMITEATKLNQGLNAVFKLTDGKSIPFDSVHFDAIVTTNTIYFWDNPQAYAKEIARVLKPGGTLCIGFIPESTMQHIPFAKYGFTQYNISTVTNLLNAAGIHVTSAVTDREYVTSNSGGQIEREFVILTAIKI